MKTKPLKSQYGYDKTAVSMSETTVIFSLLYLTVETRMI